MGTNAPVETEKGRETSGGFSDKSTGGRKPKIYNLDMILSVGYRVNSKRGIAFRRWANNVLKQYIIQGYAINEKRLAALQKTIDIQTRMLACTLNVEEADILRAVNLYTDALVLLDQYDHQTLEKPKGNQPIYRITYEDCRHMVDAMEDSFHPYADGCKRIAASLFLEFLDKNNALFQDGEKRLSDGTLVAVTLMIAESNPEEKEVMVKLVMNLLNLQ